MADKAIAEDQSLESELDPDTLDDLPTTNADELSKPEALGPDGETPLNLMREKDGQEGPPDQCITEPVEGGEPWGPENPCRDSLCRLCHPKEDTATDVAAEQPEAAGEGGRRIVIDITDKKEMREVVTGQEVKVTEEPRAERMA